MDKGTATNIATMHRIPLHTDFHMLTSDVVDRIIASADERKYRKPVNANGSPARYFYAYLCRAAK